MCCCFIRYIHSRIYKVYCHYCVPSLSYESKCQPNSKARKTAYSNVSARSEWRTKHKCEYTVHMQTIPIVNHSYSCVCVCVYMWYAGQCLYIQNKYVYLWNYYYLWYKFLCSDRPRNAHLLSLLVWLFRSSRTMNSNWMMSKASSLSNGSMNPRCSHFGMVVRAWLKPSLFNM